MWNFPPHDISIIQYWLDDQESTSVLRQRMDCIRPGIDDVGFLNLACPSEVIANVQVSSLDPQKVRRMTMVGSRKTVMYNNVADDKIAIHERVRTGKEPDTGVTHARTVASILERADAAHARTGA